MKTIWIVDDDEEMARAVGLMLQLMDIQWRHYLSARAGAEALLDGGRPDLMILDINMPDVSGLELLEFIRSQPDWLDIPIIMLSTEAADVTVDKALALGADTYVSKPVTYDELEKALKIAFEHHPKK